MALLGFLCASLHTQHFELSSEVLSKSWSAPVKSEHGDFFFSLQFLNEMTEKPESKASQVSLTWSGCDCFERPPPLPPPLQPSGQHACPLTDYTCRSTTTRWMSSLQTYWLCEERRDDDVLLTKPEEDINFKDINYDANVHHYSNTKHMRCSAFDHKPYKTLHIPPSV